MIRLLVYESSRLYREGLRLLLEKEHDAGLIRDTGDMAETMQQVKDDPPDLCVVSLDLLHYPWNFYNSFIWELGRQTKVLILSNSLCENLMFQVVSSGIKGYLSRDIPSSDLVRAVREIAAGGIWFQAQNLNGRPVGRPSRLPLQPNPVHNLTAQEIRVLEMMRQRLRNKEIATRLNISEQTVKCHVHRIFRKLKITRRGQVSDYTVTFSSLLFVLAPLFP